MSNPAPPLVLIVDDDEFVRAALSRVLVRGGYRVATHDSGFGLAEAVGRHCPRLVLLDVTMPGLSGSRALEAMNALEGYPGLDVPVLLHSGLPEPRLSELAQICGAVGYLLKPQMPAEVLSVVRRLIAEPRREAGRGPATPTG